MAGAATPLSGGTEDDRTAYPATLLRCQVQRILRRRRARAGDRRGNRQHRARCARPAAGRRGLGQHHPGRCRCHDRSEPARYRAGSRQLDQDGRLADQVWTVQLRGHEPARHRHHRCPLRMLGRQFDAGRRRTLASTGGLGRAQRDLEQRVATGPGAATGRSDRLGQGARLPGCRREFGGHRAGQLFVPVEHPQPDPLVV